jgi:uncharacterized membrane protein YeiB
MTRRALMPDCLRRFALFGILIASVQYIAFLVLQNPISPHA